MLQMLGMMILFTHKREIIGIVPTVDKQNYECEKSKWENGR